MKKLTFLCIIVLISANVFGQSNYYQLRLPNDSNSNSWYLAGVDNNEKVYYYSDSLYTYENNIWSFDSTLNALHPLRILFDSTNTGWFFSNYMYGEFYNLPQGGPPIQISNNLTSQYPQLFIYDFYIDVHNNIWACGTYSNGSIGIILKYNYATGFIINTFPLYSPAINFPTRIRVDANGNIYIAARDTFPGSSIFKFYNNSYQIIDSSNFGLISSWYSTFDIDPSGNLWIIGYDTFQGDFAIVFYNGISFSKYFDNNLTMAGTMNENIHIKPNGDVWLGDDAGLYSFDGVSLTPSSCPYNIGDPVDFMYSKKGFTYLWDLNQSYRPIIFNEYGFNNINGVVFHDLNSDGIRQSGEYALSNQKIFVQPTNDFTFSNYNGYNIPLIDTSGSFTVSCIAPTNWHLTNVPSSYSIAQTYTGQQSSNINFGFAPNVPFTDAAVSMYEFGCRPGFTAYGSIYIDNLGSTVINDTVTLVLPLGTNFLFAYPYPVSVNGNIVKWLTDSILPFNNNAIWFDAHIDSTVAIGSTLHFETMVGPQTGDIDPTNNIAIVDKIVTGSYDPNEKTVDYPNPNSNGYISPTQELIYTVFFQNTGTDTAFNVVVKDTISSNLDLNTLRIIGASHDYTVSLHNGLLRFDFNNILLPDSNVNELLSHGYLRYAIKPKANLANGTNISNTAYIFFDYNVPIVTNTTSNTILITAVGSIANKNDIKVYPNPASKDITIEWKSNSSETTTLEIMDLTGRTISKEVVNTNETNSHSMDIAALQNGVYLLRISNDKQTAVFKVVKE